ncbi:hypothetical protein BATDEDRAFT_16768 [Batrachochytrium dendrobatidis JAM81]|uniref:Anaphase-promoting complex subunit 4 WD40 domain-containing protein n=1 Tax=Batrachochytrium dendrobatidis (strain JAM81 / FGSC 10211) TaxID=684364 RepID=F4P4P8_BATDJ|nr:uncharacterized protein BATDEDRAFT_16768 [Batrachochytrium dendrobatidis JAM81]EGF79860.1 hypothetical protein BATDEDRAFT_16768 [Batrachochytrium dendrobatidis JAM81]KAJ8322574.1 RNA export factor gle2 [Batrachochytrium dendrobatidis]KAK5673545.1 RNA export factor gle2 [Batrachochytrium dendrobatidis]|eukprot:XP_006679378.1 hypothetical protein BATDEDRAFT_16768 [Batrachochytrium dendrobatidis JAM81]
MISTTSLGAPKDIEVPRSPGDGVTGLAFSPQADFLAASSWDNQTRIYEVQQNGTAVGKAAIQHEAPVLDVCWSKDGTKIVSVGADRAGRMLDMHTGQSTQVAGHDAPIKSCRWIDGVPNLTNMLVTGSWDKTVKYWDLRSQAPAFTLQLPERCYSLDVAGPLMVVGTAERHILAYNLNNPSTVYKQIISPLKWQTRVISCFPSFNGYAIGSIEGRVAIQYIEDRDAANTFSFKCHREDSKVFPINSISFHPTYGTFSTAGADGAFNFWDKDSKQRLKLGTQQSGSPISATCFNRNGTIFAYAVGYDWHKGHEHNKSNQGGTRNVIMLHPVKDEDIKPKPKKR